jgi:ribosomal protein S18 acetylase RimI-like enzyme
MTDLVKLRPAEPRDEQALGRLGAMLVAEHHEFDLDRFLTPTGDITAVYGRFLVSQLAKEKAIVLVADRDGDVVGYVFGALQDTDFQMLLGPAGKIYDLIVDPDHWKQGIGGMLLQGMLDALAKRGAPRAVLYTAAKNENAQRLFDHMGFRRTMIEMTRELD